MTDGPEYDWCVDCGSWRVFDGWECPVCRAREQLAALREAYRDELAALPPNDRERFASRIAEPIRTPQPRKPSTAGMEPEIAERVLRQYDRRVQEWELREIRLEKDRVKQATHRVRNARKEINDG